MAVVAVELNGGRVAVVRWGNRTMRVRAILEAWSAGRRWWRGEWPLDCYLIETTDGVALEVAHDGATWTLCAVQD